MSQMLINKMRAVAGTFGLLVCFLVLGTVDANSQSQNISKVGNGNPYAILAQKLGVTACDPSTSANIQSGLAALEAQAQTMKQTVSDNSPVLNRVKYQYYVLLINSVGSYNAAVEIAALRDLERAVQMAGGSSLTMQQLAGLYNGVKPLFGMCQ